MTVIVITIRSHSPSKHFPLSGMSCIKRSGREKSLFNRIWSLIKFFKGDPNEDSPLSQFRFWLEKIIWLMNIPISHQVTKVMEKNYRLYWFMLLQVSLQFEIKEENSRGSSSGVKSEAVVKNPLEATVPLWDARESTAGRARDWNRRFRTRLTQSVREKTRWVEVHTIGPSWTTSCFNQRRSRSRYFKIETQSTFPRAHANWMAAYGKSGTD